MAISTRWRHSATMVAMAAIAVVSITTIRDLSHYHFRSSYEGRAKPWDSSLKAHNTMPKHQTRARNGVAQGDGRSSSEIGNIKNTKQWSDAFAKSNHTNITTRSDTELVLPNILLIGAQKAGTTTVASLLIRNGVCSAEVFENEPAFRRKEVHFFDKFYKHGIGYYAKRFKHCTQGVYRKEFMLDATPAYLPLARQVYDTYSNENVSSDMIANLKLMVILREPVSRELSWYNHKVTLFMRATGVPRTKDILFENGTVKSFDEYSNWLREVIMKNPGNPYGFYVDHLRTWVELFNRQQLLILSYDELLQDPSRVRIRIERFLGMSINDEFRQMNKKRSKAKVAEISAHARQVLEPLFKEKNEELYDFIRQHPGPPMEQNPFRTFHIVSATWNHSMNLF